MAQRAESLNVERVPQTRAPLVPLPTRPKQDGFADLKERAVGTYRITRDCAARSYRLVAERSSVWARNLKRQIQATHQHPLRIIALAAGTAFCFGVILRVWRSKQS